MAASTATTYPIPFAPKVGALLIYQPPCKLQVTVRARHENRRLARLDERIRARVKPRSNGIQQGTSDCSPRHDVNEWEQRRASSRRAATVVYSDIAGECGHTDHNGRVKRQHCRLSHRQRAHTAFRSSCTSTPLSTMSQRASAKWPRSDAMRRAVLEYCVHSSSSRTGRYRAEVMSGVCGPTGPNNCPDHLVFLVAIVSPHLVHQPPDDVNVSVPARSQQCRVPKLHVPIGTTTADRVAWRKERVDTTA